MTETIFITGASSGIGKATALYFQDKGWNVVATLRDPAQAGDLAALPLTVLAHLRERIENHLRQLGQAGKQYWRIFGEALE